MEIYAVLINLRRSRDRLAYQQEQLARLGIHYERLEAVEAESIPEAEFQKRSQQWQRPLSRGEVACFLSHRLAWRRVVAEQVPMLILEDDAVLSDNLATVLAGLKPTSDSLIYNLETGRGRKLVSKRRSESLPLGHSTVKIYRDSGGSAAYVITPKAAEICLQRAERHTAQADAFVNVMPRVQIEPGLAVQMDMLEGMISGDMRPAAVSTIHRTFAKPSPLRKLVRRPRMKLRRLASNLQVIGVQLATLGRAKKRAVPYCPSIAAAANSKPQRQFSVAG
jgi:glycosyl transferase, family 25